MGSQAKIWGKVRVKQHHKHFEQSRVWLKQNEEQERVLEVSDGRGSGRIWWFRIELNFSLFLL